MLFNSPYSAWFQAITWTNADVFWIASQDFLIATMFDNDNNRCENN